jgi:hypothetical protein
MKVRHAHRPRISGFGASSVTAFTGVAAIAAILPGHAPVTPANAGPAAMPAQDTVSVQVSDITLAKQAARRHSDSALLTYRVRSGDTISGVAVRKCGKARFWTGIYAASRAAHLTGRNANVITIGQLLAISCHYDAHQLRFAPAPPPPPPPPPVRTQATTTSSAASVFHHRHHHYRATGTIGYGTVRAGGSYEACVISRESGGQTQVMNASGHYGLYQFDYETWVSGGGAGADFGHASASEQQRVFRSVYAARGTQPWSPSDGC